ncbi:FIST N-terminal domain-containing protein [Lentisphaerota bacterium WC36G]|nr:FIST C-terminal domain-containing protein [Lentisphaerae bacterium WC36]
MRKNKFKLGLLTISSALLLTVGCINQKRGCNKAVKNCKTSSKITAKVGYVHNISPEKAGYEAVESALSKFENKKADLIIVYVNYKFENATDFRNKIERAFKGARAASNGNMVIGTCATAGILSSEKNNITNAVGAVALKADANSSIKVAKVENILHNLRQSGENLASLVKGENNKAMLLFTDSNISHNQPQVKDFLAGVQSVVNVPVAGGNSTGFSDFNAPVYYKDKLIAKSAIAVMLSGNFKVGTAYANNFDFVNNKPLVVTKSDGRKVYEVNNQPIDKVVQKLTNVDSMGQKNIGAALKNICAYKIDDRPYIRFQRGLKVDEIGAYYDGWPNKMPVGTVLNIAKYNQSRLITSAKDSVKRAMQSGKITNPYVLFSFNCNGRSGIGQEPVAENKTICETVGLNVPVAGYYACGEITTTNYPSAQQKVRYAQFSSIVMVIGE